MNKTILTVLIVLLFVLQLFVPAQMIFEQEDAIDSGTAYKFKTQPIDPTDPFRGKYIVLNYELNSFETNEDWSDYKGPVFVYLDKDDDGYAVVTTVSKTLLELDQDYVIADSRYNYDKRISFNLPFNRFYMNENKAYDAEISVRQTQRDTSKTCYGLVFVKDATAVLDNVFIDDIPIQQFVTDFQNDK